MMMRPRGKVAWVPAIVDQEIVDIMREDNLPVVGDAWRELVKYARVGREANRLKNFDWSRKNKELIKI